ncbi:hypothetical protein KP509_03G011800 [Ceratopteris richardii]|uniref:DUF4371 domain-containing protein n=1 Tax=Ceratopteris richardii TaxID=49495 RepID=A0A8T2V4Q4_CERRI|nr:hypothetical protein KP509_03G011800 [Ceratopteris richardii]
MHGRNKSRVITCMKLAYFVSKQDISLMKYEALCELAFSLDVKDMPLRRDYSSYINIMAAKEFITCISCYLENHQRNDLSQSPYLALMIDESTDRALEKHLIVYASFFNKDGLGVSKCEFLKLIVVADGYAQTKYNAIMNMFFEMSLDIKHLVGISIDGDSSMLGCHEGLVSKLSRDVPNLIVVHCVAHREALALVDACKCFPYLSYLLQEMNLQVLEVLQIHDVRWLARGNVMVLLVKLLPAILTFWKCQAPMCTSIEVCLNSLKKKILGDIFAKGTIYLKPFIENAQMGHLKHVNENGEEYTHTLLYVSMRGKDKNGFPLDIQDGSLNTCIEMAKDFVLKVIDCVNERFLDMYFFSASKLFNPILPKGFSKQNIIKTYCRQHLKVDTLDMLMRISMLGPSCDLLEWEKIYDI